MHGMPNPGPATPPLPLSTVPAGLASLFLGRYVQAPRPSCWNWRAANQACRQRRYERWQQEAQRMAAIGDLPSLPWSAGGLVDC